MASNRFAALSPDYEQEEVQRKQQAEAAKAKKESAMSKAEEKPKTRTERKPEGQAHREDRRPAERGRGRGTGRPYRGRGGYPRNAGAEGEFVAKEKPDYKEPREFKFTGNEGAAHPFDRKSGTGRGTEVPKRGGGRRNWGNPADDWKNAQKGHDAEEKETPAEQPKEGEVKKDDVKEGEKKPEAPKVPEVPTYTYSEYQAMLAEKQKGLPVKKAEVQVTRDPKAAAGLVAYEKPVYVNKSEVAAKKKETGKKTKEVPTEDPKAVVFGGVIPQDEPKHFRKFDKPEDAAIAEGERRSPAGKRGRGGFKGPQVHHEEKKTESTPFTMKEDDFPAFK